MSNTKNLAPVTLKRIGGVLDYFDRSKVLNPHQVAVDYIIDQMEKYPKKKVWLLEAQTGSGKSTVLPPELLKRNMTKNICSTQPRVINAISIPEGIPKYNPEIILGENIGYSTGDQKLVPRRGLVFMTDPTLLCQMKTMREEDFIRKWMYIIIDEVHQRSVGLDIMFYKIKTLVDKYKDNLVFPQFVLTSATFDVLGFAKYYNTDAIMYVEGISFAIHDTIEDAPVDSFTYIAQKILDIHKTDKDDVISAGDICLFIPGAKYGEEVVKEMERLREEQNLKPFEAIVISGDTRDAARKTLETKSKVRRIIFGTNAIETGVTLDELKFLVDSGIENFQGYHPPSNTNFLLTAPVSASSARQRRGRVGRKMVGYAHKLYTKEAHEAMIKNSFPEIQIKDITGDLMYMLIERFDLSSLISVVDVKEKYDDLYRKQKALLKAGKISSEIDCKELLAPPGGDAIARAISNMHRLGYIDIHNIPTPLGLIMNKLPGQSSFEANRTIMAGVVFDVSIKELVIMTLLTNKAKDLVKAPKPILPKKGDPPLPPPQKYKHIEHFCETFKISDKFGHFILDETIELLIHYHNFKRELKKSPTNAKKWCGITGVNYKMMTYAMANLYSILRTFDTLGFKWKSKNEFKLKRYCKAYTMTNDWSTFVDYITRVKMCIYQGYKMNLITRKENGYWKDINGADINISNNRTKRLLEGPWKKVRHCIYASSIYMAQGDKVFNSCETLSVMTGFIGIDESFY